MIFTEILFFVFLGVLTIQFLYWLFFSRILFHKTNFSNSSPTNPPVSVIICTWNEEQNLKKLIPIILAQEYPDFELVIVDDRSSDESYNYVIKLRDEVPNLKVVRIDTVPDHIDAKKYAITLGIKAASHDVLLFCDADCRPRSKNWIKQMAGKMTDSTSFVLGFSPYKTEKTLLSLLIGYETIITAINYLSSALWGAPYMGVGRNLMYRKSLFIEEKGFHGFQKVTGGDDDLFVNKHSNAQNCRICIHPEAIIDSIPKTNWDDYLKQKRRHLSVGKHYKIRDKWKLTIFSISQILFWICFVTLAALQVNPYVVFGGFALRLVIQIIVIGIGSKKMSNQFPMLLLPISDLIYSVYLPVIGIPALVSKKVKWS